MTVELLNVALEVVSMWGGPKEGRMYGLKEFHGLHHNQYPINAALGSHNLQENKS